MKLNIAHLFLAFTLGIMATSGVLMPNAYGSWQPHMSFALDNLRTARHQLEMAEDDKGSHRVRAIADIDKAIDEVTSGIEIGNK